MKKHDYDTLMNVGADTPMGKVMRQYWHPIALSSQVPEPDCAPLTTWLLNERLVVFRDTDGKVGVLNDRCMHRGVSLGLGRVEEGGIRCIYHGWKFSREGKIMETPNLDNAAYRERKKAPAYPVREVSGLIWTYIGPADQEPPFRTFDFDTVPNDQRTIFRANADANYLLMWEGGVDSSHVGVLHTNVARPSWGARVRGEEVPPSSWDALAPTYDVQDTEYGYRYVAFRAIPDNDEAQHARAVPAMLPNMRIIPGHADFSIAIIEVPMTDKKTATYQICYSKNEKIDRAMYAKFLGFLPPLYDEKTCEVQMSWPNGLHQNREAMKENFSGYPGIELEDVAMALSLTEDWDRSTENLVQADIAVMRLRQVLQNAIKVVAEGGRAPGVDIADMTAVIGYDATVKKGDNW